MQGLVQLTKGATYFPFQRYDFKFKRCTKIMKKKMKLGVVANVFYVNTGSTISVKFQASQGHSEILSQKKE